MSLIVDGDSHLYERPDLWQRYIDPNKRDLAIVIEPDALGHWWVSHRDERFLFANIAAPGEMTASVEHRQRQRAGESSQLNYAESLPDLYWDPSVRRDQLDAWGLDHQIQFPHWGLNWEWFLRNDLDATRANLSAWNRWAVDVFATGEGRLHPVGHVSMRGDLDWLDAELSSLSRGGVRLANLDLGPVDGKRPSHPDLDRAWSMFCEYGITPCFHIGAGTTRTIDPVWFENDHHLQNPVLELMFMSIDLQLLLSDLVLNGVLERHPTLKLLAAEFDSAWLPTFLAKLDIISEVHAQMTGARLSDLQMKPSDYLRGRLWIESVPRENPAEIRAQVGDMIYFGGDFPHGEGFASPLVDYRAAAGDFPADHEERFYGGALAEILGLPQA